MTKNRNDITGDKIITKTKSKAYNDKYEIAFGNKQTDGQGWQKHDGSPSMPTAFDSMIEVETYASSGNIIEAASKLNWQYVKFYKVVPEKK